MRQSHLTFLPGFLPRRTRTILKISHEEQGQKIPIYDKFKSNLRKLQHCKKQAFNFNTDVELSFILIRRRISRSGGSQTTKAAGAANRQSTRRSNDQEDPNPKLPAD